MPSQSPGAAPTQGTGKAFVPAGEGWNWGEDEKLAGCTYASCEPWHLGGLVLLESNVQKTTNDCGYPVVNERSGSEIFSFVLIWGVEGEGYGEMCSWLKAMAETGSATFLSSCHPTARLPRHCCHFICACHSWVQASGSLPWNLHTLTIVC